MTSNLRRRYPSGRRDPSWFRVWLNDREVTNNVVAFDTRRGWVRVVDRPLRVDAVTGDRVASHVLRGRVRAKRDKSRGWGPRYAPLNRAGKRATRAAWARRRHPVLVSRLVYPAGDWFYFDHGATTSIGVAPKIAPGKIKIEQPGHVWQIDFISEQETTKIAPEDTRAGTNGIDRCRADAGTGPRA